MVTRLRMGTFVLLAAAASGCYSPYHADRGALFGGLTGAGLGAVVGQAVGKPGAGALIGAGTGAIAGSAIGASLDEMEARNRQMIESRLGRPVAPGAVTIDEVIAMSQAGVADELIVNHIESHGVARIPSSADLIRLQQAGVSTAVVRAMQRPVPPAAVVVPEGPPVVVEEHYVVPAPPVHYHPHGPRFGWGVAISSDGF